MTTRHRRLTPEELSGPQRSLYEAITGGDRASGVQHFPLTAADGSLHGPFGIMLHSPEVGMALQELGARLRFRSDLTARVREAVILMVARATGSDFEWWAHARVARAVGLTDEELTLLAQGRFTGENPVEAAAVAFCVGLLESSTVSDADYEAATSILSERQVVDLTVLVGYYRTLAQLMAVFGVDAPADEPVPGATGKSSD